jgi:hypothetical protein
VEPNEPVRLTIDDFRKNRDKDVARALEVLESKKE